MRAKFWLYDNNDTASDTGHPTRIVFRGSCSLIILPFPFLVHPLHFSIAVPGVVVLDVSIETVCCVYSSILRTIVGSVLCIN